MSYSRSNVIIVIDGLSSEQLADLGQYIKNLAVPPIVTLVKTVPILSTSLSEEKQLEAKHDLATAKESLNAKVSLNINAAGEIVLGSNPMSAVNFFIKGSFDAMITRGSNGQPAITVKTEAPGIPELAKFVKDLSKHKTFQQSKESYKDIFVKPPKAQRNIIAKRHSVPLQPEPEIILKPKVGGRA